MEIVKFGGSSMATAATIKLCREIVRTNRQSQIVVVSAPGKYGTYTTKVTDDLIQYTEGAPILDAIIARYHDIATELLPPHKAEQFVTELQHTATAMREQQSNYNFIVSRGEYLAANLFALDLDYNFVDAQEILIIKPDATIDLAATEQQIKIHQLKHKIPFVIGGFYGQRNGQTALFTRGGSDYTGAILAALMHASLYKNYTDTNGIQTANPQLVVNTQTIPCLDFDSLDILTHNGAGIIHENVAKLLETYHVPLRVDNTFNPHQNYTEVHSPRCRNCQRNFFCITCKDNQILVVQQKPQHAVNVQILNSTPQTLLDDMQRLHTKLLRTL